MSESRPVSPYVFGDATPQPVEHGSQIHKLLRSPSEDQKGPRAASSTPHEPQDSSRNYPEANHMNGDHERQDAFNRRSREPFDLSMRRHSIAAGSPGAITLPHLSATQGIKRKLSTDRSIFLPVGEEIDPQLVGPGVPSIMEVDSEAPAPKRRGSTIDTQRIAQLSLEDRRNSVDSRISPWGLLNERRDSAPALLPPMPGFAQVLSPNEPKQLPGNMASFAWDPPLQPMPNEGEHHISRPFDPTHHMNMIPPMNFPPDRRMSVPDTLTNPPVPPSRVMRSRSRPPSRQDTGTSSGPNSAHEDAMGGPNSKGNKESVTPYSRSPELRVSHKLAERKRRKEMKELFDDLRDQLPQDRGMKASKWEILTKAIEFVGDLKAQNQSMSSEIDLLRRENDSLRQGNIPSFSQPNGPPPPQHTQNPYGQIPPISSQFPHLPPANSQQRPQQPPQTILPPITPHHPSTSNVNQLINQNGHHRADAAPPPPHASPTS
ncbi:hypothetical protein DFP72DRAFT_987471 [Ephemerocybe angulata]|nr:hypothetical protein DFP72DRAFT_987471 [Tulosesus angulatus]